MAFKFTEILNVIVTLNTAAVIPFGFKLSQLWIAYQKRALALSNEKLQTELRLLKNQINPHFLFNTLNNVISSIKQDVSSIETNIQEIKEAVTSNDRRLTEAEEILKTVKIILGLTRWIVGAVIAIALSLIANFVYSLLS